MNEEKAMVEYKESKGIFGWLKSKFEKLKERFNTKRNEQGKNKENQEEQELFEEDLDNVPGGIPLEVVDIEELKADLGITEPKSWNLTEEEQELVEDGYEEIRASYNQQEQDEQELFEEDLDKITAGHPIIEDDGYSR